MKNPYEYGSQESLNWQMGINSINKKGAIMNIENLKVEVRNMPNEISKEEWVKFTEWLIDYFNLTDDIHTDCDECLEDCEELIEAKEELIEAKEKLNKIESILE